jgi:hypothetical protein
MTDPKPGGSEKPTVPQDVRQCFARWIYECRRDDGHPGEHRFVPRASAEEAAATPADVPKRKWVGYDTEEGDIYETEGGSEPPAKPTRGQLYEEIYEAIRQRFKSTLIKSGPAKGDQWWDWLAVWLKAKLYAAEERASLHAAAANHLSERESRAWERCAEIDRELSAQVMAAEERARLAEHNVELLKEEALEVGRGCDHLLRESAALREQLANLENALEEHGTHLDCSSWMGLDMPRDESKCDCGLRAALAPQDEKE